MGWRTGTFMGRLVFFEHFRIKSLPMTGMIIACFGAFNDGDFPMTELALLGATAVFASIMVLFFNKPRLTAAPVLVPNRKRQS
jgi:hypothetical protein